MKKILLLVLLAISANSYAQFKASPNGIVSEDGKDIMYLILKVCHPKNYTKER